MATGAPLVVMLGCGLLLSACTTIEPGKAPSDAWYFGAVHVRNTLAPGAPRSGMPIVILDIQSLGLSVADGIGFGYSHERRTAVPLDCRLVVFVQNQKQFDDIARLLADKKENICPTSQSPF
jgi:hypothetical protein